MKHDLAARQAFALRAVRLDIGYGHGLDAPGMVDQDLCVHTKGLVERLFGMGRDLSHGMDAHMCKTARRASADAPEVRDGSVVPERLAIGALVELAKEVGAMLGRDVEGDLGKVEVRAQATGRRDARRSHHVFADPLPKLAGRAAIEPEVTRHVQKGLVDGVDMDVLGTHVAQVDGIDVRRPLDVECHAWSGRHVVDVPGDLEHATAVAHTECLHRR